jgi:nicotinamidase-related amidase
MLIERERALLVIVDVQERVTTAIPGIDRIAATIGRLLEGARLLGVPVLALEQNPAGLGATSEALRRRLQPGEVLTKLNFAGFREPDIRARIESLGRRQIVLAGIEAHVCVLQTALSLLAGGYETFVVADAVGSREVDNRNRALDRLARDGVGIVTSEMVLFEWLGRFAGEEGRAVVRLVK